MNTFLLLCLPSLVTARDLQALQVIGNINNFGGAFVQTEFTTPTYTPGTTNEVFDTVLDTNFTNGFGRFLGERNTSAFTEGPGLQTSGGASNITGVLGTGGFFLSGAQGILEATSGTASQPGTSGFTFTNTTNEIIGLTSTEAAQGSFVENGFQTGAVRLGLGQTFSNGTSYATSYGVDFETLTLTNSSSVGGAQAVIVGNNTVTFANGDTFSVSGSEETVTGCGQEAGAAAYGGDVGLDGSVAVACSSRGSFQGQS